MNLPLTNADGAVSAAIPIAAPPDRLVAHAPACAPWVQTHLGHAVDLLDPQPDQIHPQDIAVALARVPRFGGHTVETFSVAQHSVLTLYLADEVWDRRAGVELPREMRLAVLLHDAHEAYVGDIATPLVSLPGWAECVKPLKHRLQRAIHARFGLPEVLPEEWLRTIQHVDLVALATEKRDLMAPEPRPWAPLPEPWERTLDIGCRYWLGAQFSTLLRRLSAEG